MSISGENLSKIIPYLGVQRLNKPGKGHIMGAKLVSKTLKIFNLTTTNATLMKLTTIVCIFIIPLVWEKLGIRHRVLKGMNKRLHRMSQKISFLA